MHKVSCMMVACLLHRISNSYSLLQFMYSKNRLTVASYVVRLWFLISSVCTLSYTRQKRSWEIQTLVSLKKCPVHPSLNSCDITLASVDIYYSAELHAYFQTVVFLFICELNKLHAVTPSLGTDQTCMSCVKTIFVYVT